MEHQAKPAVVLTGVAKEGKAGPPLGTVDIGRSEGAYLFRVALPGVRRSGSKFHSPSHLSDMHAHTHVHTSK